MKKTITVIVLILMFLSASINITAYGKCNSWFIKRNGNKQPTIPKDAEIIYNYDGYYIDKKLSDSSDSKKLYLTFDIGYENGNTEKILDTLNEYKIPAAFFVLDNVIIKNPDLIKRMVNEGHLICNHTLNHRDLTKCSDEEIEVNIVKLEELYKQTTGCEMEKYFRFPEGRYSEDALRCIQKLGYKTIFWSFAYEDWDNNKQPRVDYAKKKILENTHNGAVLLFHPTSETNAIIMPDLIKEWISQGYTFGNLHELTSE